MELANPVMTASGTAGHGAELGHYFDLADLGAVVVKSLSAEAWAGNPAPRVYQAAGGMLNSVGLQNPGVGRWREEELPALVAAGARVVASIWGFTVEDYGRAATLLQDAPVIAVEVNVSCPNVEDRRRMFAHSRSGTADAVGAAAACGKPLWAKLSPNVTDLTEIAGAALAAGAETLTLTNTLMGLAIDPVSRRPRLGGGGGGLSGPALHPVAVRAVAECRDAFPDAGIVGVGGVMNGEDAVEFLVAGADAVQVGTATFIDPKAPVQVLEQLRRWIQRHQLHSVADLRGPA